MKPYGKEMSKGFEASANGYLLSQDKPVGVFIVREDEEQAEKELAERAWSTYWNQGLASVLILHLPQKVKVYSLLARGVGAKKTLPALVDELSESIRAAELLRSIDEGALFREYSELFPQSNRVDQHLLGNLLKARKKLTAQGLARETAQSLLLQILFIAYLEDRGIIPESDFFEATGGKHQRLEHLLASGDTEALDVLFANLQAQFNGDVFAAPGCFSGNMAQVAITPSSLQALTGLRKANIDEYGQYQLFQRYDFKYIPIPLLSAIYDRFQTDPEDPAQGTGTPKAVQPKRSNRQRETGSFFTPAHLAQVCLTFAWESLPRTRAEHNNYHILDPACGSAVFLVCAFQRIVGMKISKDRALDWQYLASLLSRLHGCDREASALHVGIVSLYIALLEYMDPPALLTLRKHGKLLPQLFNKSMWAVNYFSHPCSVERGYDLIIGNPPWVSRQGDKVDTTGLVWCKNNGYGDYTPSKSPTWAFLWKCGQEVSGSGIVALLINAAHVFGIEARKAMGHLLKTHTVTHIYNYSDACFQLFKGAKAPAALCIFRKRMASADVMKEMTTVWSPKANPDYCIDQRIVLAPSDKTKFRQQRIAYNPSTLTTAKWARTRDLALLADLKQLFPPLGQRVVEYKLDRHLEHGKWIIGQGFNPGSKHPAPTGLNDFPLCDDGVSEFRWVVAHNQLKRPSFGSGNIFEQLRIIPKIVDGSLKPPLILIKQGADRSTGQLQAGYTERAVVFSKSIQAIASPNEDCAATFKLLTAVLNSRLAAWFFLHIGSVTGIERFKVLQSEIPLLPFPLPEESPNPEAGKKIVSFMDQIAGLRKVLDDRGVLRGPSPDLNLVESQLNEHVYAYYGLTASERQLVEDSWKYILPSVQPPRPGATHKDTPPLWRKPDRTMLLEYARLLQEALAANYYDGNNVCVSVYYAFNSSLLLAVAERGNDSPCRVVDCESSLRKRIQEIQQVYPSTFALGVQNLVHVLFAEGDRLILIKPNRVRHWMPSEGLCDADKIVSDLRQHSLGRAE